MILYKFKYWIKHINFRKKTTPKKLQKNLNLTVSNDWHPTSGHLHWRSPRAAVHKLYNYIRPFLLKWNSVKHWNKFMKVFTLRSFGGAKTRAVFFRKTISKNFQLLWWSQSFNFFRLVFLQWFLRSFRTLAFLSSWVYQWFFKFEKDFQWLWWGYCENHWCNQVDRNANVKNGRKSSLKNKKNFELWRSKNDITWKLKGK